MSYFDQRVPLFLELGLSEQALPRLKSYMDLLWASNSELNLFSRKMTIEELIDNHLIDCLLPLKHLPQDLKTVADFGSGGGLPGVVYAIQYPEATFQLFEKSSKKQSFLKKCQKIATNLEIKGEIPSSFTGVDLVTARAFKPVDVILDLSRAYYQSGGKYFLLKARLEKIDEEMALAQKSFKDLQANVIPLKSPVLDVERHIVQIQKA